MTPTDHDDDTATDADDGQGSGARASANPISRITGLVDRVMDSIDDVQRSWKPIAVLNGVLKKYGDDRGSQLAKLIAYNGFFSMFPLLLVSVSVLGIVLRDNPELRQRLVDSALSSIPVLGTDLNDTAGFSGGGMVLVVSILLAFWAGLGLLDALGEALNTVWNVPRYERPGWVPRRLRAAGGAVAILLCAGISGVGNWVLGTSMVDPLRMVVGAVFPTLAGALAFLALNRILCVRNFRLGEVVPGAVGTALGWWGLFSLGNFYFNRVVRNASDTYGAFAVVLGLLSWSYLLGTLFVYSTELSSVLAERIWPRSLTGRRLTAADEQAMKAIARRELKDRSAEVLVQLGADDQET